MDDGHRKLRDLILKLLNPRTFDGPVTDAFEAAKSAKEPVFVPVAIYTDDRGWSIMNQLQGVLGPQGQINFSMMYPNVIKAWHRHRKQTDFWICLTGNLKVGVHCDDSGRTWLATMGEKHPGVMIVPPPLWHGAATIGHEPACLLYYVTHAYDPQSPDEDRRAFDSVEGFPWGVRHG
ncbi:MAG: hypothetical protein V3U29_03150 [Phycisphaeraceae bacterium]